MTNSEDDDNHNNVQHHLRTEPTFVDVTARQVMGDVAEWWVRVLLRDTNVDRFQCLETVLPQLSPLDANTPLASQFRVLSLWQEVLTNTHLQGDFAMLQDKLLLLSTTTFGKSEEYEECMQLMKVHELLGRLYATLSSTEVVSPSSMSDAWLRGMDLLQKTLPAIYLDSSIPEELTALMEGSTPPDIDAIRQDLESLVASNNAGDSTLFAYDSLRDRMQALLLHWVDTGFESPMLVRLGYRMPGSSAVAGHQVVRMVPSLSTTASTRSARTHNAAAATAAFATRRPPSGATSDSRSQEKRNTRNTLVAAVATAAGKATAESEDDDATAEMSENEKPPSTRRTRRQRNSSATRPAADDTSTNKTASEQQELHSRASLSFDDEDDSYETALRKRRQLVARRARSVEPPPKRHRTRGSGSAAAPTTSTEDENRSPNSAAAVVIRARSRRRRRSDPVEQFLATLPTVASVGGSRASLSNALQERQVLAQLDRVQARTVERVQLAALAKQPKNSASNSGGFPPKRKAFTDKELAAVKEGVRLFGSDWARIKVHFRGTLGNRSALNIKDRARTLVKKGKLSAALLVEPRGGDSHHDGSILV